MSKLVALLLLLHKFGCYALPQDNHVLNRRQIVASQRIINGRDADISNFSYQLSLRRNGNHVCGAAVLSTRWAITAAHCIYGYDRSPRLFELRGGTRLRLAGGSILRVQRILQHPAYNDETFNYDVALLKTALGKLRGRLIRPVPLVSAGSSLIDGTEAIISGWGHMSSKGDVLSKVLKFAKVYTYNQLECNDNLKRNGGVTNAMFCAAAQNTDACQGDSGGPIVANGILIGLVSWGVSCADPYYPGVYTRLSNPSIRQWIHVMTRL